MKRICVTLFAILLSASMFGCKTDSPVDNNAIVANLLGQSSSAAQVVDVQAACARMRVAGSLVDCNALGICHAKATIGDVFELYHYDAASGKYHLAKQGVVTVANCIPAYLND